MVVVSPLLAPPAALHAAARCSQPVASLHTVVGALQLLLAEEPAADFSLTDTLADIAVYGLLASVAGLTIFSVFVTLDESNKAQGGWTKPVEDARNPRKPPTPMGVSTAVPVRRGARYDPATDSWTYPDEDTPKTSPAAAPAGTSSDVNRYDRRMEKKRKKKTKKSKQQG
jgi:hypothetical protein|mmetsp:Transcript_20327/g.45352  ORF Transcript_20327/g.45352 Transcript_20327/m.45352 type:complete len:170 (-) Transcript_20327:415-924(-)